MRKFQPLECSVSCKDNHKSLGNLSAEWWLGPPCHVPPPFQVEITATRQVGGEWIGANQEERAPSWAVQPQETYALGWNNVPVNQGCTAQSALAAGSQAAGESWSCSLIVRGGYARTGSWERGANWGHLGRRWKGSPGGGEEEAAWSAEIMEPSAWHPSLESPGGAGFLLGGETVIAFSMTDKTFLLPWSSASGKPAKYLNEGMQSF